MERIPNRLQPYFEHTRTGKIGFELVKCTILLYRYFDGCLEHAYETLSELFKINKLAVEYDDP